MAGDRPPNPREAVCRHRPRRPRTGSKEPRKHSHVMRARHGAGHVGSEASSAPAASTGRSPMSSRKYRREDRKNNPPFCAAGKYRLDCSSAEWRRQLVDRTATLPAETESRQPLRACLLAGREQRGFIRPATAQVRKRGRGSGRVSAWSLAGRVEFIELAGFDLAETGVETWMRLWLRGGLPRS